MSAPAARPTPPERLLAASMARGGRIAGCQHQSPTGLATDYLNHFNEAIMLLEMIPDMPECAEDFLQWRPLSYRSISRVQLQGPRPRD